MTSDLESSPHLAFVDALDRFNCGVLVRDGQRKIVFANERLIRWLGYEREELLGLPTDTLLPPELRELAHEEMLAFEKGDVRTRLTVLQRKDSSTFPALVMPQLPQEEPQEDSYYFTVIVDLGSVQTAKATGFGAEGGLRSQLDRVALEIQTMALAADSSGAVPLSMEHAALQNLSPREREVLVHLMGGGRVPTIAKELGISQHTVRNHLKAVFRQLGVGTQAELIELVRSLGRG